MSVYETTSFIIFMVQFLLSHPTTAPILPHFLPSPQASNRHPGNIVLCLLHDVFMISRFDFPFSPWSIANLSVVEVFFSCLKLALFCDIILGPFPLKAHSTSCRVGTVQSYRRSAVVALPTSSTPPTLKHQTSSKARAPIRAVIPASPKHSMQALGL